MMTTNSTIKESNNHWSLISLNINGLNSPNKRHRQTEWLGKYYQTFCCFQETHFSNKDRHYLRVKSWKKILQANVLKKQAGVVILLSNKIYVQLRLIKKYGEGHFNLIKGKIHQEDITILCPQIRQKVK